MLTDEELIKGCARGERKAQKALYDAYGRKLLAVALRYSKKQDDAEDILQEAFIRIFSHIQTFKGESSFFYWMKRIVVNTALNYHRRKLYMFPMLDVDDLYHVAAPELTLAQYHYNDLLRMLQELPDGCQIIFNLYAIEGYQHKEIAEMLGISEGTSKSQYSRAKSLLREMIEEADTIKTARTEKNGKKK